MTVVPTAPPGDGEARRLGLCRAMVMVNVWQAGVATPLVAHTVVGPKVPAASGEPVRKPSGARLSPGGRAPVVTEKVGSGVWGLDANWWR